MIKKFAVMMLLAVAIIFVSNQAEAREVYVGSYSDGTKVYLITNSVRYYSVGRAGAWECSVRASRDYLNYQFWVEDTGWQYNNSEGYHGYVYNGSSPVAAAILNYIRNHY